MTEYLIKNKSLISIADEIRILSETQDYLNPANMATKVKEANTMIDNQTSLIVNIINALEGKTVGAQYEMWEGGSY